MKLFILGERTPDKSTIVGWVQSREIIDQFTRDVFPAYQRDRVNRKKKINDLKNVINRGETLPAVSLNLIGSVRKVTDGFNFEGDVHVIDGQQRICAMVDAGKPDYLLCVQAYVNLPYEVEVKKFQDLNTKGTKLPFGYLVRSIVGPSAELVRKFARRGVSPLPIAVHDRKKGITFGWLAPIVQLLYMKLMQRKVRLKYANSAEVASFLADGSSDGRLSVVEFATRNLLSEYARIFGSYDHKALAYSRSMFMSIGLVIIHNFVTREGRIEYRGFRAKMNNAADFLSNAYVRQLVTAGGSGGSNDLVYDEFIRYLNRGCRYENRLHTLSEMRNRVEEGVAVIAEIAGDASSGALTIDTPSREDNDNGDDDSYDDDDRGRRDDDDDDMESAATVA